MKQLDVEYLDLNYLDSVRRSRSDYLDPKLGIPRDGSKADASKVMDPKVRYRRSDQLSGIHLAWRHPPR
jgi:hypothetical protein